LIFLSPKTGAKKYVLNSIINHHFSVVFRTSPLMLQTVGRICLNCAAIREAAPQVASGIYRSDSGDEFMATMRRYYGIGNEIRTP